MKRLKSTDIWPAVAAIVSNDTAGTVLDGVVVGRAVGVKKHCA